MKDWREWTEKFRAYEEDWDSYGCAAPAGAAIDAALALMERMGAEPFHTNPNPDGGMCICYRPDGWEIEVDIDPDGALAEAGRWHHPVQWTPDSHLVGYEHATVLIEDRLREWLGTE